MVFLCSNIVPPPADLPPGTSPCPLSEGTWEGTLSAISVTNRVAAQGIGAREFEKLPVAIRFGEGFTYANVHTTLCPPVNFAGRSSQAHRQVDEAPSPFIG